MTEQKTVWPSHYTSADVAMIENVKQWIADRDYTQAALARLARISSSTLNQIIKGAYATSPSKMLATVEQYGAQMAAMGIEYGLRQMAGETFTGWVKTDIKLITAADLAPVRAALAAAHRKGTTAFNASGDLAGLECKGGQEWSSPPSAVPRPLSEPVTCASLPCAMSMKRRAVSSCACRPLTSSATASDRRSRQWISS